jgi:hypothetical protein
MALILCERDELDVVSTPAPIVTQHALALETEELEPTVGSPVSDQRLALQALYTLAQQRGLDVPNGAANNR